MSSTTAADRAVLLGRCLLSLPFILGAGHALAEPGSLPDAARSLGLPQPELLTHATAGLMLGGAVAVGAGLAPATGGAVLAGSLLGTTMVVHSFWRESEAPVRAAHQRAFVANCGLLGGVVVMTAQAYTGRRARRADQCAAGH